LSVRRRKRRRIETVERQPLTVGFVSDRLGDERKFRSLNIVDHYSRECVAIEVDT